MRHARLDEGVTGELGATRTDEHQLRVHALVLEQAAQAGHLCQQTMSATGIKLSTLTVDECFYRSGSPINSEQKHPQKTRSEVMHARENTLTTSYVRQSEQMSPCACQADSVSFLLAYVGCHWFEWKKRTSFQHIKCIEIANLPQMAPRLRTRFPRWTRRPRSCRSRDPRSGAFDSRS